MGTKLIVFGLLCGTVIQALPRNPLLNDGISPKYQYHPLVPGGTQDDHPYTYLPLPKDGPKSCNEKLDWFKKTTEKFKGYYDDYYTKFQRLRLSVEKIDKIEVEHKKFKDMVEQSLEKYEEDKIKLFNVSDTSLKAALCLEELDWFKLMNRNLSTIAEHMRGDVSNVMEALGVPKETRDSLDAALARVVNYLFIIDLTKNTFKDLGSLAIELNKKTVKTIDGLKPENANKGKPEDVEYGDDALESEGETAREKEDWSRTLSDLADASEIEKARLEAEERSKQIEKEREEKIQNEEGEPFEHKPYEVVPRA